MKTAESIAQQQEQTQSSKSLNPEKPKRKMHPNSLKNLIPYVPGVSGNPGGEPGYDVAAALCRAVIEGVQGEAYKGLSKQLAKGNAYALQVVADRGYGKLKETKEIVRKYQNVPREDLAKRITELLRDLGLADQINASSGNAGGAEAAGESNQTAQVLSGDGAVKA